MPILTEPESNPRWGFLHGLGVASPAAVPLLLADPQTGAFSNERFEALKKPLIDAMTRAWADYQKTMSAAERASGLTKAGTEREAGRRLKDSLLQNTLPRLNLFQRQLTEIFKASNPLWNSKEQYEKFLAGIQTEIALFQADAAVLKTAADLSFYNALKQQAAVVLSDLYEAGKGVVGPAVWLAKSLPWILGIGAVVLLVGPTLAGGVRSGRAGAASAFESDVRAARGAIASGARRAFAGAPKRRRRR